MQLEFKTSNLFLKNQCKKKMIQRIHFPQWGPLIYIGRQKNCKLESLKVVSKKLKHKKNHVTLDGANNYRKYSLFHMQEKPSLPTGLH